MKKDTENFSFNISYSKFRALGQKPEDLTHFVSEYYGEIKAFDYTSEKEKEVIVGFVKVKIFHLGSMRNHSINPIEVFDLEASDLEIYGDLYKRGELKSTIEDRFEDSFAFDICLVDRIIINPEFRGMGITKLIIQDLVTEYEEACKFILVKAFPLQFEGGNKNIDNEDFKDLERNEKKAKKKLTSFYKDLGFINVDKVSKEMLFLPLSEKNEYNS